MNIYNNSTNKCTQKYTKISFTCTILANHVAVFRDIKYLGYVSIHLNYNNIKIKIKNQWKNVIMFIWTSNLKIKEIRFIAVRMCLYWLGGVRRGLNWQFSVLRDSVVLWIIQWTVCVVYCTVCNTAPKIGELWYTANFRNCIIKCMHVSAVHFFVPVEVGYFCARIKFQDFPSSKKKKLYAYFWSMNISVHWGCARSAHSKHNISKAAKS